MVKLCWIGLDQVGGSTCCLESKGWSAGCIGHSVIYGICTGWEDLVLSFLCAYTLDWYLIPEFLSRVLSQGASWVTCVSQWKYIPRFYWACCVACDVACDCVNGDVRTLRVRSACLDRLWLWPGFRSISGSHRHVSVAREMRWVSAREFNSRVMAHSQCLDPRRDEILGLRGFQLDITDHRNSRVGDCRSGLYVTYGARLSWILWRCWLRDEWTRLGGVRLVGPFSGFSCCEGMVVMDEVVMDWMVMGWTAMRGDWKPSSSWTWSADMTLSSSDTVFCAYISWSSPWAVFIWGNRLRSSCHDGDIVPSSESLLSLLGNLAECVKDDGFFLVLDQLWGSHHLTILYDCFSELGGHSLNCAMKLPWSLMILRWAI